MLQLVETWLRGSGKQWLLVLDNSDLEAVLFEPVDAVNVTSPSTARKRTIDFLAIPSCGQTLLTTRHNKVASQFVDDCDIVTVGPMTKSDAMNLFRKKAGEHHDAMDSEKLVGELGNIPLAIAHAAAFIKRKVPLCTVQTYLGELRKTAESDASLLTANYNELRRDDEADNSVINTWQVSFEHIRHIRPSAADRLSLMSFYDHRSIPITLLKIRRTDLDTTGQYTSTDADLDGDLLMLYEFHLISIGVANEALELHPLVQLAARKWLKSQNREDQWLRESLRNLSYTLPDKKDSVLPQSQWRIFLPHIQLALTYELQDKASALCLAEMCGQAAYYITFTSGLSASQISLRRCWAERTRHLGKSHIITLRAELRLAGLLMTLGKKEEGQNMFKHCSTMAEKHSDSSHGWKDFHIQLLHEIGKGDASQGNFADAETYFRRALELSHKHPGIAYVPRCVDSLKDMLLHQKKQSEAENTCRHALVACIETYGSKHKFTLRVAESLADVLYDKGVFEEALEMYNDVFEGRKHTSGVEYLVGLHTKVKIARTLQAQKKSEEAVVVFEQVRQLSSDRYGDYGEDMVHTLHFAQNYAISLSIAGKVDRALEVMKACATDSRRILGPDHQFSIERTQFVVAAELLGRHRKETQRVTEEALLGIIETLRCLAEILRGPEKAKFLREAGAPEIEEIVRKLGESAHMYGEQLLRLDE